MAKDKKSFILYSDLISVVKKLVLKDREDKTNHAGELFLHILEYVNDGEPIPISFIVDMAFEPIKLSLKRDLKKYEVYIEKQRENGKKGGRPKNPKEPNITQAFSKEPKKADSVSVSDNVNDTIISKEKEYTQQQFLKRWKDARLHFDKKPTNISKLKSFDVIKFEDIKKTYSSKQIEQAMQGFFSQDTFKSTRLHPSHFLELENFEKYLTCFETGEKLFDNKKYVKLKERI